MHSQIAITVSQDYSLVCVHTDTATEGFLGTII